jgi:hypothetical protein
MAYDRHHERMTEAGSKTKPCAGQCGAQVAAYGRRERCGECAYQHGRMLKSEAAKRRYAAKNGHSHAAATETQSPKLDRR